MSKLISMMAAGALAAALGGFAFAADSDQRSREPQAQPMPVDDPAAGGATTTQAYHEYLVELKNCEPLTGSEREACIEAARKKHGQM